MNGRLLTFAALPMLVAALFALLSFHHQWLGEWNWTIDTITGSTVLTGPLTAGLASWLAMRTRRLDPLTRSTQRSWVAPMHDFLSVWALSLVIYAVTMAAAMGATLTVGSGGRVDFWMLSIGPLVLAACAAIGVAVGNAAPYRISCLLVGLGVFAFGSFGPAPLANLFRQGPVSGSLAGLRYSPVVWLAQSLGLIALSVLALAAAALLAGWHRSAKAAVVVGSGIGLLAIATLWLNHSGSYRFEVSDEHPTACTGAAPKVCVAPSHRSKLTTLATALGVGAEKMRLKGLEPPERYEQILPSYSPPANIGMITQLPQHGTAWVWTNLMTPGGCSFWTDPKQPPPDEVFEVQALLEAYVVKGPAAALTAWSQEARTWLASSDKPPAKTWAQGAFRALQECDLNRIRLPWAEQSSPQQ